MLEGSKVIDYSVFAASFKNRYGEYPRPFLTEVRRHLPLEITGEVPSNIEGHFYLATGDPWEGPRRSVTYHVPRIAQRQVFEDFSLLSEKFPVVEVDRTGLRRGNDLQFDILGNHVDDRGRATVRVTVAEPERIRKVVFKHRQEYIQMPEK